MNLQASGVKKQLFWTCLLEADPGYTNIDVYDGCQLVWMLHMCLTYQAIPCVLFHIGSDSKKNASRIACLYLAQREIWGFNKIKIVS